MAKVLQNFLIGVGLDTEGYDDGAKRVEGSLGRMRTLVGFTGAAITGAFAAAGGAAITAGKRVDDFNLAAEKLKTPTAYVYAYGRALAALGGDAEEALAAIEGIEKAQADLKLKGMLGPLEDVALSGGDINALEQAPNGAEFLRTLSPMVQNMDKEQRGLVQRTLGLSDAVMRSLSVGVDKFDAEIARAAALLGGGFEGATESAREFSRAAAEIGTRLDGIGDTLAEKVLPGFTDVLNSMGGFIDRNRDKIESGAQLLGENQTAATLATGGAVSSAAGAALRGIGMRGAGSALMRAGPYGMAAGGAMMAWDVRPDEIESITGYRPNDYIFDNTPLDAARDAYNSVADKYGFERSEKDSGAISYLEGGYDRVTGQMAGFESYLNDYVNPRAGGQPIEITESPTSGFVTPYDPVYSGGEVSNVEAAQASPDVVMVRDQRHQADRPPVTPRIRVDNHLEAKLSIDGRALDSRTTDVIERRERDAMDDVTSSVNR